MKSALFALTIIGALLITGGVYNVLNATQSSECPIVVAYTQWKQQQGRLYATQVEDSYRLSIFAKNYARVQANLNSNATYTLELNKFADLEVTEFIAKFTGLKDKANILQTTEIPKIDYNNIESTQDLERGNVDWVHALTAVKDQGGCGSCWAFSSCGALEALYFINNGTKASFSEQLLVDCTRSYGEEGCLGGDLTSAFSYTAASGEQSEASYPYLERESSCNRDSAQKIDVNTGVTEIPQGSNTRLTRAVNLQPVSVGIAAGQDIQLYQGGIFRGPCADGLNHAVLVVGYGVEGSEAFYKIRNSWGGNWGESGYIRFHRDNGYNAGTCGVTMMASYPN